MKKILLLIYMMFPVLVMAQGHKGEVDECAPMKNGKVCYSDDVEIENTSKLEIFNAINAWAKKSYGKDVFLSNVNSNKNKGTIFVSSKVELLLNDTDKTIIKGEFYQFNLSSCIRQQNSLTAQFVSFSLSNLANIFYPPQFLQ